MAASLYRWGAIEVRTDITAVLGLTFFGAIWILLTLKIIPWLGISLEYDVFDCRNTAAAIPLCGTMMATSLLYTGGSLGEGPSYGENVFSAGLGTVAWLGLWFFLEISTRVSTSITEERDLASGLRLSGLLIAAGLMLGRATAGNWVSTLATVEDFIRDGWPAAVLIVIAVPIEWITRPSRSRPFPSWIGCGLVPAFGYLAAATGWFWYLSPWEGMPS